MDDLRQPDGVNNPDQTKSFEQWVIRQFQGQDFFPDIQPAKNVNERTLVFVSRGGDIRFTVECIWKKMLSGPWKWTAMQHPHEKPGRAAGHFLALGVGGTAENPERTYFIHANG